MTLILNHTAPERKENIAASGNILRHGLDGAAELPALDPLSVGVTYS